MLTNIFESRNKTFLNLVKLGDYLGRSLRENVEIFSVDNDEVTYLTESGAVIKGNFSTGALNLTNIEVQDSKIFEDKKLCSQLADQKQFYKLSKSYSRNQLKKSMNYLLLKYMCLTNDLYILS